MCNFNVHPVGQCGEVTGDLRFFLNSFKYFACGGFVKSDHKT
jgi:hypothetical protein